MLAVRRDSITIFDAMPPADPIVMPLEAMLLWLRAAGWTVARHNDFRLGGELMTFWLFTHEDGRWKKGEAKTDTIAVRAVLGELLP